MPHNALFNWEDRPDSTRYAPGFFIGSENDDGSHRRDLEGWPYSIYKKATDIGVTDHVLCHGIQNITDATCLLDAIHDATSKFHHENVRKLKEITRIIEE
jgi:hypothetical protein